MIIAVAMSFFGFAGGGGSSSGGGGGGSSSYSSYSSSSSSSEDSELTPFDIVILAGCVIFAIIVTLSSSKKAHHFKDHNQTALEKQLHEDARIIFTSYQTDWSNLKFQNLHNYTTDNYYEHASLMMELLQDLHRVNKVSKLKISQVYLLDPVPDEVSAPIRIRFAYVFDGLDEVEDTKTHKNLYRAFANSAEETWNYIYDGKSLKLDGISQPTESAPHLVKSLASFANQNHLFYSPDWGRYALPSRGLIFGGATMSVADINNHVIGKWKFNNSATSDSLLIQLYSYSPTPNTPSSYYIVGQINVPKDYLGVIVESKVKKITHKPDKSYEKFELEWPDFNKRYDVYAASRDALPAFELLNPKFMEYLYSKNPAYNLEVVDNIIYIFANIKNITESDYQDLLEVLKHAYDELKY